MSTEKKLFENGIRRYLDEHHRMPSGHGAVAVEEIERHWRGFAELGWLGLTIPEDFGGLGLDYGYQRLLMQEFGRSLLVSPYVACCVLASGAIQTAGSEALKASILPAVASGELKATFSASETTLAFSPESVATTAVPCQGGYRVSGVKSAVPFADISDVVVLTARTPGPSSLEAGVTMFLVDLRSSGISMTTYAAHDGARVSNVTLRDVFVSDDAVLGSAGEGLRPSLQAINAGLAALCAESVGCMKEALAQTIAYMKVRTQFRGTLSSFQALQHRVADTYMRCIMAEAMLRDIDDPLTSAPKALSAVKYHVGTAAAQVVADCVQLHGAIGLTSELAIGRYFKRITMINHYLGDPGTHLTRYAARLEDENG